MFFTVSKAWHLCQFLEWKFIEFSGLFHCLIIKVPSEISDFATTDWRLVACAVLAATRLYYHNSFSLSSTFLKVFEKVFWIVLTISSFQTALLYYHRICGLSTINFHLLLNGDGGIWTLAPVARPTPLAGAPLQPLEYISLPENSLPRYWFFIATGIVITPVQHLV